MIDVRIYHALHRFLPRILPRWAARIALPILFAGELLYLRRLRPLWGAASERYLEYSWVLRNLQANRKNVLDVGCGDSLLPYELSRRGFQTRCLDLQRQPFYKSRKLSFVRGDVVHAPFADSSFDQIVCVSTIEHIGDDVACMTELRRILKENGSILATVPLGASFYADSSLRRLPVDGLKVAKEEFYIAERREWSRTPREQTMKRISQHSGTKGIACLLFTKLEESQSSSDSVRSKH